MPSNNSTIRTWAIIAAGGRGKRMGGERPKQFCELGESPMYQLSMRALSAAGLNGIVIVVPPALVQGVRSEVESAIAAQVEVCAGGLVRRESVRAGFERIPMDTDVVVVHDAARPFLPCSVAQSVIDAATKNTCALACLPVTDTLKRGTAFMAVAETVDRANLYRAQTPQAFRRSLLERILSMEWPDGSPQTDEAMGAERLGVTPRLVLGSTFCFKITSPEDYALAQALYSWLYTQRRHHADWSWL